ncbi:hypothetical protein HPB48_016666 [Haemaphysalis longicornis]|uniref:Uncharacterized protein n=1 Tax=Haemaphysalis longicornis TaxID=44386 RepID=A0A9J6G8H4_HAELO|nr:hypothetical protein HPB48_016666 [Haemaphysalis longicornis]
MAYKPRTNVKVQYQSHCIKAELVLAKSRFAAVSTLTFSRLAAPYSGPDFELLGERLLQNAEKRGNYFGTDSFITLYRIRGNLSHCKEFHKKRVTQIEIFLAKATWPHGPGNCNTSKFLTGGVLFHIHKTDKRSRHLATRDCKSLQSGVQKKSVIGLKSVEQGNAS